MPSHHLPVIKWPASDYRTPLEEQGSTAKICRSEDGRTVLKFALAFDLDGCDEENARKARFMEEDSKMLQEREKEIYKLLGQYKRIVPCLNISALGLKFPYFQNGSLRHYINNVPGPIQLHRKRLWAEDATKSISFIHAKGVLQADISARNLLVADDLSLLLCDFSGSAIGDKEALVGPETRYRKVAGVEPHQISIATEIFAVGSLIYEIMTGKRPYEEIEDEDAIEGLFKEEVFPPITHIPFGSIIYKCWTDGYITTAEVFQDIIESS